MGIQQFTAGQEITALELNQLPVVVSYLTTGNGGASSTSEVSVGTFTIPAGDPTFPGGYWLYVHGVIAAGAGNLTLRMRLNGLAGTIMNSVGPSAPIAGGADWLCWIGFESIGVSGTLGNFSFTSIAGVSTPGTWGTDATAINTTIPNTLTITAQFATSNAGNLVTTKFGSLYRL